MTVKEVSQLVSQELSPLYPETEIGSFVFLMFNHLMNFQRFDLHLKEAFEISDHITVQIYDIIEQLKQHKPIQYILGTTEFYGLVLHVDESVLIPRPETEELVEWIISDFGNFKPKIIDIGSGSGCIPIALAKNIPGSEVFGADISEKAIVTSTKNASKNNVAVHFLELNILSEELSDLGQFNVIVSNPPYVTIEQKENMEANVIEYEPHVALFVPKTDPLVFYKAICRFARKQLRPNGALYFEINEALHNETAKAVEEFGFSTELRKDINSKYRMLKATMK